MGDTLTDKMAIMTSARQDQDFATLQAAIAGFPGGASLEQVAAAAVLPISERTLIRRLRQMTDKGLITCFDAMTGCCERPGLSRWDRD